MKLYCPKKSDFKLTDLENLTLEKKLNIIQSKDDTYNLIKNELLKLHETNRDGTGINGLNTVLNTTRIIDWTRDSKYEWVDTVKVAILPSTYPVLPESTYKSIPESKLYGSGASSSHRALAKYGLLVSVKYNWGMSDKDSEMSVYDSIRAPEMIYGMGKRADHKNIAHWRVRLKGLQDRNGHTKSNSVELYKQLWLDPTGAFSISYPETANTMASILSSLVPSGSSIIDMTACMGGNSAYFSYYFNRVTAIEIAPHRQQILEHNLRILNPGYEEQVSTSTPEELFKTPKASRTNINILIGDSLDILTKDFPLEEIKRFDPLGEVLFLDPPWGGSNYMYLPRPLQLEMITKDGKSVSAAEFLRPILERIRLEQNALPSGKGILSKIRHIGMKVPNEYDIDGLRRVLKLYNAVATDPFIIPDNTKRNRVNLIIMTLF